MEGRRRKMPISCPVANDQIVANDLIEATVMEILP